MGLVRSARRWWTQSNPMLLLESQDKLLSSLVNGSFERRKVEGLNCVEFRNETAVSSNSDTVILAHGFGSGLGFFYKNVDELLRHPSVGRVLLVDWLGMGGSERPQCSLRPIRGWSECTTSWCDSRYTPTEALNFFINPFQTWMQKMVVDRPLEGSGRTILVGHSLGGYLSAQFAVACPDMIDKLVLASPVGFPSKPDNLLKGSQLPTSLRILDTLWSSNLTPQQLVRMMGASRGRRNTRRVLQGRIAQLRGTSTDLDLLADYLYHITVADPSGEFAMNSLLEPVVSSEIMGVFAREPLQDRLEHLDVTKNSIQQMIVLFGDHDWMRPNEHSARATMREVQNKLDINASVHILQNAGHHLYLDNADDFVRHIVS